MISINSCLQILPHPHLPKQRCPATLPEEKIFKSSVQCQASQVMKARPKGMQSGGNESPCLILLDWNVSSAERTALLARPSLPSSWKQIEYLLIICSTRNRCIRACHSRLSSTASLLPLPYDWLTAALVASCPKPLFRLIGWLRVTISRHFSEWDFLRGGWRKRKLRVTCLSFSFSRASGDKLGSIASIFPSELDWA